MDIIGDNIMDNIRIVTTASGHVWDIYEGSSDKVLTKKGNMRKHIVKIMTDTLDDVCFFGVGDTKITIEKVKGGRK